MQAAAAGIAAAVRMDRAGTARRGSSGVGSRARGYGGVSEIVRIGAELGVDREIFDVEIFRRRAVAGLAGSGCGRIFDFGKRMAWRT